MKIVSNGYKLYFSVLFQNTDSINLLLPPVTQVLSDVDRSCENGEILQRIKEERNIEHTVKQRKANFIGRRLRWNCFVRQVIEGKMEEKTRKKT